MPLIAPPIFANTGPVNVLGSRANATTYTNTSSQWKFVQVWITMVAGGDNYMTVDGLVVSKAWGGNPGDRYTLMGLVRPGGTYRVDCNATLSGWNET